eukprot:scaffold4878_cov236-Alexandrium_tamarense.AAC.3
MPRLRARSEALRWTIAAEMESGFLSFTTSGRDTEGPGGEYPFTISAAIPSASSMEYLRACAN